MSTDTETMGALVTESGRKAPARLASSAILACQSDERLVELVRDGHERAFEAIVARYRDMLVRFCAGILPESRAEDAVQLAFLNAHTALRTSDEVVQLKPWLFAITRNAALNMLRQNGWNYDQIPDDFDGVMRPDQAVEQKIELQTTVAAVNDLPERQRRALVMRELEGRSYEEIALALAAGDGAVRQLLNRARGTLRSIAAALMPPPLVARAAASLPPSDGRRVAEVLGSFGAAGIVKVGASAVVAGSLVVGAVKGPLPIGDHHPAKTPAPVQAADHVRNSAAPVSVPQQGSGSGAARHSVADDHGGSRGHGGGSDDRSGRSGSGHRSGAEHRSGSDDHSGSSGRSGSDEGSSHSGTSGGSDDSRSGTSGGSNSGPSGGSDSSGHGSDDVAITTTTPAPVSSDGSGSSGSGSGTSGSGSTETTSSDSGTSGSGSGESLSTNSGPGSATSGSSDSTTTTTTTTTDDH